MSTLAATNLKHASSASNNIVLDTSGNTTISGNISVTGTSSVGGVPVVTTTGTQTLTNKTLTSPIITGASVSSMASSVITSDTAKASTSGTNVDFTGIPSWVKQITLMLAGVSTNGTSILQIQLGTSGGFEATGYLGSGIQLVDAASVNGGTSTTGFQIRSALAANTIHGGIMISNITGNQWVAHGALSDSSRAAGYFVSGSKSLGGVLTQIRVTTVNGTDAFDAGTINIMYQ